MCDRARSSVTGPVTLRKYLNRYPVESDRIHGRKREARDERPAVLYPTIDEFPDLFHPSAVDAEVAVADPGGGPEMDRSDLLVE